MTHGTRARLLELYKKGGEMQSKGGRGGVSTTSTEGRGPEAGEDGTDGTGRLVDSATCNKNIGSINN